MRAETDGSDSGRRLRAVAVALPLAIFAGVVLHVALASPLVLTGFPLDDAWIHRVYARSFAFGDGFAYNPGDPQAGATSPLWAIATAPAHWLDGLGDRAAVVAVKLIGVALTAGSLLLVVDLGRRLTASLAVGVVAAALLAVDARLSFAALSGMENPLLVFLFLLTTRELLAGRGNRALLLSGLLPVTRPETALLVPLVAVAALRSGTRARRWCWALAGAALPSLLWALHCERVSGHLLPTTFYLKARPPQGNALEPLASGLVQHGLLATPLAAVGLLALGALLWRRRDAVAQTGALMLLAAPALDLLAVAVSRELHLHGYYWTRYLDPGSALLAAAAALGAAALVTGRFGRAGAVAGLLAVVLSLPWLLASHLERRARLVSDTRAIERIDVEPAHWLAAHTPPDAVIGVNDAGAARYFGERRIVDLVGLNDAEIAFHRPTPPQLAERLDWLVVFPRFAERSGLAEHFDLREIVRMPVADYTVCDCPGQATVWIMSRPDGEPGSSRLEREHPQRRATVDALRRQQAD